MDFEALAEAGLEAYKRDLPGILAVDTETTGFSWYDEAFCATVSWQRDEEGVYETYYIELAEFEGLTYLEEMLRAPTLVGHNLKFDLHKLIAAGAIDRDQLHSDRIEDTEALAHILDENQRKGLKELARVYLKEETDEETELRSVRRKLGVKKDQGYAVLPREVIVPYALKDAEFTIRLYEMFAPAVGAEPELSSLYRSEMALTLTLLDMEAAGIRVDVDYLTKTRKEYFNLAAQEEMKLRLLTGRQDFNPRSPQQVLEAFEARGQKLAKTDEATLRNLDDPLATALLSYRSHKKMLSTYLESLLAEQQGGIAHPSYRQHGTRTGRMSSGSARGD